MTTYPACTDVSGKPINCPPTDDTVKIGCPELLIRKCPDGSDPKIVKNTMGCEIPTCPDKPILQNQCTGYQLPIIGCQDKTIVWGLGIATLAGLYYIFKK